MDSHVYYKICVSNTKRLVSGERLIVSSFEISVLDKFLLFDL